jgi:uncharacterized protein (DUF697 family)
MAADPETFDDVMGSADAFVEERLGRLCLMCAGLPGSGKTTLVQTILGYVSSEEDVERGYSSSSTNELKFYDVPGKPLTLIDTVGFELESDRANTTSLLSEVKHLHGAPGRTVHLVLYCVQASKSRIDKQEFKFCERICKELHLPLVVVITQKKSPSADTAFQDSLQRSFAEHEMPDVRVVPVLAVRSNDPPRSAHGIPELAKLIRDSLPKVALEASIASQEADLSLKRELALKIVSKHAKIASTLVQVPVPFSDFYLLIPNEIFMLSRVCERLDLPFGQSFLATLVTDQIVGNGATLLGRSLAKTLCSWVVKFVPGINVAAGAFNGLVAHSTTKAFGMAFVEVVFQLRARVGKRPISEAELAEALHGHMEKQRLKSE